MRYEDENIWLTQKMMATLYDVSIPSINQHLKRIFFDNELEETAVVKQYLITAADGKSYQTKHYNLQAIIAVGFKIENERAEMHYAVHGNTAAEVIVERANHQKEHMGLTHWEGAPKGKIYRYDVTVAKNYLSEFELEQMQRIVSAYLDMAEMQAMRKIPMTMEDWEKRLNGFLNLWDREILQDAGKVTAEIARTHAETEFEKYRIVQDRLFTSDFDKFLEEAAAGYGRGRETGEKAHTKTRRHEEYVRSRAWREQEKGVSHE